HLPISLVDNPGIKEILNHFVGKKIEKVSGRTIGNHISLLYTDMLRKQKDILAAQLKGTELAIFNVQHDGWSSNLYGFLGSVVTFCDTRTKRWQIRFVSLGVHHFKGTHSSENTLKLLSET